MPSNAAPSIHVAAKVAGFSYAIRNIVAEAQKVEAEGRTVRYLNIGDPILFGFKTPPHLIAAVERAMRDGHNGYVPSVGLLAAREAVAAEYTSRGAPVSPDRVVLTSGASEGIELALSAIADSDDEVLVPSPTYPLYTAVIARIGARAVYYRTDPAQGFLPDVDHIKSLVRERTRALVVIDPNNPTGAVYPTSVRAELLNIADRYGLAVLADEVYGDLAYAGPVAPIGSLFADAPVLSFSSLSKGYLAPGWRAGWVAAGRSKRLDGVLAGIKKLADGRLCSPGPMQMAVVAALTEDRSHQKALRAALAERAAVTTQSLRSIPGVSCVEPAAAFYAMPKVELPEGMTDEQFVIALLRKTGILCVHGSGFGMPAEEGFFRVVFLASPSELTAVLNEVGAFVRELRRG